jgi:non-ribosomal peptide synthetase component F
VVPLPASIAAQVDRTPDAIAVSFDGEHLTYRELDQRANRLAHHLLALGARADESIAVVLERSVELVVTLLAIMKSGAAYLPLDPAYPPGRTTAIVANARCRLAISLGDAPQLEAAGLIVVSLVAAREAIAARSSERPAVTIMPGQLAYVIYTSGSTGQPKGVMNTHGGLQNRLAWMQQELALRADDCVLQKTPYTFDVSVWEFFWPMLVGARLVVARPDGHRDPFYLSELIERERVTTLHFVPSMLEQFLAHARSHAWQSIRMVICSVLMRIPGRVQPVGWLVEHVSNDRTIQCRLSFLDGLSRSLP